MFSQQMRDEIERWRWQTTPPEQQLDRRWVERFRRLASYDSYWWLTWAGPFTEEEQRQWDHLFTPPVDEATKEQLAPLLTQSRQRELAVALAEQREPQLLYPAIEIDEVRQHIINLLRLDGEIEREEPNAIVSRLYHGVIEEELDFLNLIEATYSKNTEQFWECMLRLCPLPTTEEMEYAFEQVRNILVRGLNRPETMEVSQRLEEFIGVRLHRTLNLLPSEDECQKRQRQESSSLSPQRMISAQATRRFFEVALRECGYDNWQVVIDPNGVGGTRVEQGLRQIFLPEKRFSLEQVRHLLSHELLGHVSRCVAGERSLLGLLGIHTKNSLPTEEGVALYHEHRIAALYGQSFDNGNAWFGTLATGLASGVITSPQTFLSLFTFLESFSLLSRLLNRPGAKAEKERKYARANAISVCLRVFRGVPNLNLPGVCYLQDAVYLHGLRSVEQAVAQDERVLDRLAVGVVALELLPDLQELGITSTPQPLRELAYNPDLEDYILSFEETGK